MRPIDADALVEEIREEIEAEQDYEETGKYITAGLKIALKDIIKQSTLDYAPVKHGRWVIDYAEGSKIYHAHCSECEKEPTRHIGGDYYIDKLSDFCPNCGADMRYRRGEENDN